MRHEHQLSTRRPTRRLAVDSLRAEAAAEAGEEVPEKDARANRMRAEEEAEITGKLAALRDELNEVLEEVRCELAEVDDEAS